MGTPFLFDVAAEDSSGRLRRFLAQLLFIF